MLSGRLHKQKEGVCIGVENYMTMPWETFTSIISYGYVMKQPFLERIVSIVL